MDKYIETVQFIALSQAYPGYDYNAGTIDRVNIYSITHNISSNISIDWATEELLSTSLFTSFFLAALYVDHDTTYVAYSIGGDLVYYSISTSSGSLVSSSWISSTYFFDDVQQFVKTSIGKWML